MRSQLVTEFIIETMGSCLLIENSRRPNWETLNIINSSSIHLQLKADRLHTNGQNNYNGSFFKRNVGQKNIDDVNIPIKDSFLQSSFPTLSVCVNISNSVIQIILVLIINRFVSLCIQNISCYKTHICVTVKFCLSINHNCHSLNTYTRSLNGSFRSASTKMSSR